MEDIVVSNIEDRGLIKKKENIVIGVSGGPDSMALLYLLKKAQEKIEFTIIVAHVNHGVRGQDALDDETFVRSKAKELGFRYYGKSADMLAYAKERSISAEEAGREIRYGFFNEILEKHGGGKIAVAHNKNDQAETLLMRIFRGTGIDGLKGMDFINGNIIRPLLNIDRKSIEEYIEEKKIETVLDRTNLQTIYTRNKIRLELIPYIKDNYNPNIIESLWRLSKTSQIDSNFLENYAEERYNHILKSKDKNCIILDSRDFLKEDLSIQQRIVRRAILDIGLSLQGISQVHVRETIDLFTSGVTGKEIHLANEILARVDYEELIIQKRSSLEKKDFLYKLKLAGNYLNEINYQIDLKVLSREEMGKIDKEEKISFFDYNKIKGSIIVRNRRPGDRFIPLGMKGSKKIKDYFIDEKISREERDQIPLIMDGENIIWVLGYRSSELYKVDHKTEKVLMIEYKFL